jgi:ATP-dependent Clp protease ATP-binding subunit ClpA
MLSRNLESTLTKAISIATKHKHEYVTFEHLLSALMHDRDVIQALTFFDIDVVELSNVINEFIRQEMKSFVIDLINTPKPAKDFHESMANITNISKIESREITGADLLFEILKNDSCNATKILSNFGVYKDLFEKNIDKYSSSNATPQNNSIKPENKLPILKSKDKIQSMDQETSTLDSYCANLNKRAREGKVDVLIGRYQEIERTIEILTRRQKNNPILVGEPGVGKTAIAEGIAQRIVHGDVPEILKDCEIYSLDIGSLVAGTRYRGDFEERIKNLLQDIKSRTNVIMFIDEIHTIVGAGSTNTASLDASNLLKPALARGEIRCIGSTTFKEFNSSFAKDSALVRRFQKIIIEEPTPENAVLILKGLVPYYEKFHNVKYSEDAIEASVSLSERYIHDRNLPDKAIDLLDEAGAHKKITSKINGTKQITISSKDIENVVSKTVNIPSVSLASDDLKKLKDLEPSLKKKIFGQNEAIEKLCASIRMARAGLRNFNKPVGSFLFVGPTGTGKTELAKQLALKTNMDLIRFDMSEYMEPHAVSRLIGAPPGYAGYDKGGLLTEAVDQAPYSVVLLDEIEKASSEIFNILLQIMDYGKLTDNSGKVINFSHTILILTANSGAAEFTKKQIGFENSSVHNFEAAMKVVENTFSPEFRNRLDDIIMFNSLDENIVMDIISKLFKDLESLLEDKNVSIKLSRTVKTFLLSECFGAGKKGGARALERIIESKVKQFIADEILFGKLKKGGVVYVNAVNSKIELSVMLEKDVVLT